MAEWLKLKPSSYIIIFNTTAPNRISEIHNNFIKKNFLAWGRIFTNTRIVYWELSSTRIRELLIPYVKWLWDWFFVSRTSWSGGWKNIKCSNDFIKKYL